MNNTVTIYNVSIPKINQGSKSILFHNDKMNILILLLLVLPRPYQVAGIELETCLSSVCQNEEPVIRFPFQLHGRQPKTCGYPGFSVSCSKEGQTMLKLPHSRDLFTIQAIDYTAQELWINDPNNCLPKSILSLNLSGSPFSAVYLQEFKIFNCSLDYPKYNFNPIACLSDSTHTVFATSSRSVVVDLSSVCILVHKVKVPVQRPSYEPILSADLSGDLRLSWDSPSCGRCESHGGHCGLKSNSSLEIACSSSSTGIPRGTRYAIALGIGLSATLCFLGLLCYICSRFRARVSARETISDFNLIIGPQPTRVLGLDGPTIESYPKIILGESRRLPKSDDNTCSICLSEYQPKEMLKSIPECQHCFHAECIDEWLQLNASCPICRTSPQKFPLEINSS